MNRAEVNKQIINSSPYKRYIETSLMMKEYYKNKLYPPKAAMNEYDDVLLLYRTFLDSLDVPRLKKINIKKIRRELRLNQGD